MTKEELAAQLDGKVTYREGLTKECVKQAKANGLVIIYGASDDLMELDGAMDDEGSCYGGERFYIDSEGLLPDRDQVEDDDEDLQNWLNRKKKAKIIEAIFCAKDEPAWTYKTKIPHATFNIIEGDGDTEIQCRAIIFNISDL